MSEIDLALDLLDHQIVDCKKRRCGKVDDIELELEHPDGPRLAAILSGPEARRGRGLLGRLSAGRGSTPTVRVPWSEVTTTHAGVQLKQAAQDYELAVGDDELAPFLRRLPGSGL
jgi:sporulation protein YlmC with PRC-barrel domain